MLKLTFVLLTSAALLGTAPAAAESWRVVGQGGSGPDKAAYLVDTNSVVRAGDTIKFASMTIWDGMTADRAFNKTVSDREGSCGAKSSAIETISYYADDNFLDVEYGAGEQSIHSPGSVMRAVLEAACGEREYATAALAEPEASVRANFAKSN